MLDLLTTLGRTMGFSFAAGINLYATVAILGLAQRFGWVALPEQFRVFDNDVVIGAALVLYVVEFVADKIPWLDSLWDAIHTLIRPVGGALIAVAALGDASPTVEGLVALLGGTLAAGTHFTKAGTRAAANTSPEPFSNWALSLAEDAFVDRPLDARAEVSAAGRGRRGDRRRRGDACGSRPGSSAAVRRRWAERADGSVDCPQELQELEARTAGAISRPTLNVIDHGASGWPSIAVIPSSSSTFTVWKRSSGLANLISSARLASWYVAGRRAGVAGRRRRGRS